MIFDTFFSMEITLIAAALWIWFLVRGYRYTEQPGFRSIAVAVGVYVAQLAIMHYATLTVFPLFDTSPSLDWNAFIIDLVISIPMAGVWIYFLWSGFSKILRNGRWSGYLDAPHCPNPRCREVVREEGHVCPFCGQAYVVERLLVAIPRMADEGGMTPDGDASESPKV